MVLIFVIGMSLSSSLKAQNKLTEAQIQKIDIVRELYEREIALHTNIIHNLELKVYANEVIISNLHKQLDVNWEISEAEKSILKLEKLRATTKAGGIGAVASAVLIILGRIAVSR